MRCGGDCCTLYCSNHCLQLDRESHHAILCVSTLAMAPSVAVNSHFACALKVLAMLVLEIHRGSASNGGDGGGGGGDGGDGGSAWAMYVASDAPGLR